MQQHSRQMCKNMLSKMINIVIRNVTGLSHSPVRLRLAALSSLLKAKLRHLGTISCPRVTTCESDKLPFTLEDYYAL